MDATLAKLTDFVTGLKYEDLTPAAIHECKRRFITGPGICSAVRFKRRPSALELRNPGNVQRFLPTSSSHISTLFSSLVT